MCEHKLHRFTQTFHFKGKKIFSFQVWVLSHPVLNLFFIISSPTDPLFLFKKIEILIIWQTADFLYSLMKLVCSQHKGQINLFKGYFFLMWGCMSYVSVVIVLETTIICDLIPFWEEHKLVDSFLQRGWVLLQSWDNFDTLHLRHSSPSKCVLYQGLFQHFAIKKPVFIMPHFVDTTHTCYSASGEPISCLSLWASKWQKYNQRWWQWVIRTALMMCHL